MVHRDPSGARLGVFLQVHNEWQQLGRQRQGVLKERLEWQHQQLLCCQFKLTKLNIIQFKFQSKQMIRSKD